MDLLMVSDNGYKFILNYQDSLSKHILQPLKIKTTAGVTDCLVSIFFEHGPPIIVRTDSGMELFNKTLMLRINELSKDTRIVHYRTHHPQNQGVWSELKETYALRPTKTMF